MQDLGSEEVEAYVLKRQNTAAQYIVTQPIIDLCEEAVQWPGTRVSKSSDLVDHTSTYIDSLV